MNIRFAHASTEEEIKKFDFIESIGYFSIAEHFGKDPNNGLNPFEHSHDEYEFVFPLTTVPLFKYDKANYIGEVGYCYPINPHVRHGLEFNLGESHLITIAVDKLILDSMKEKMGYPNQYFYTHFIPDKETIVLIRKFQEASHLDYRNDVILDALAKQIIYKLIKCGLASGEDNRRPEKVYAKNIKKVLIFMYEHFRDPNLTISQLAEMSGYSDSYFSRSFKAYMGGDSPIVHLNKLRLSEAKALFNNKELTIERIAHSVGYRNVSTFTEAFKTIVGFKPKHYRTKFCL